MRLPISASESFETASLNAYTCSPRPQMATCRSTASFSGGIREFLTSPDLADMERALASFYAAVLMEHGEEEATRASRDWIEELRTSGKGQSSDWRSVASAAARRLACRVLATEHVLNSAAE
jgi:hypothetical protein